MRDLHELYFELGRLDANIHGLRREKARLQEETHPALRAPLQGGDLVPAVVVLGLIDRHLARSCRSRGEACLLRALRGEVAEAARPAGGIQTLDQVVQGLDDECELTGERD